MDEVRKAFEAWLREHRTSRGRNAGQSDSLRDTGVGVILWDAWQPAYAAGQREMRGRAAGFMDSMQDAAREAGDKAIVGAFGVFAQTVRALPIGGTDGP
ncbi:MAG: hypothetical protein GY944_04600 [bacterium]|nr:hypothetical protein [bacterium]